MLRPHWDKSTDIDSINNWDIFYKDLIQFNKENNINNCFGLGHSIGGNLLLKAALHDKKYYSSIVLLDPTIFTPPIIYIWKLLRKMGLTSANPMIRKAQSRRTEFDSTHDVFKHYRKKRVFSLINDKELQDYINSIFNSSSRKATLSYDKNWEAKMYETAGLIDMEIWNKIDTLQVPTLIIIPDKNAVFKALNYKKIKENKFITVHQLDSSTHLFPLEKPDKVAQIVTSFFNNYTHTS